MIQAPEKQTIFHLTNSLRNAMNPVIGNMRRVFNRLAQKNGCTSPCSSYIVKIIIFALLVTLEANAKSYEDNNDPEWVSIINLIATPEKYHGKSIFVTAYLKYEIENMSLCLMKETISTKECIWINVGDETQHQKLVGKFKIFSSTIVSIHGTFDSSDLGHFGAFSGAISDVTDIFPAGN